MSDGKRAVPPRPMLPLSFWALVVTLVSEYVTLRFSVGANDTTLRIRALALAAGLGVSLAVLLSVTRHANRESSQGRVPAGNLMPSVGCLVSVGLAGCLVASLAAMHQRAGEDALSHSAVSSWNVCIETDPRAGTYGYRARATMIRSGLRCAVWLTSEDPLDQGQRIHCVGRFAPLSHDDYGISSWCQGLCGSVRVVRVVAREDPRGLRGLLLALRSHVIAVLEPEASDGRAVLAGCVCGSRAALDERGVADLFARCGSAHLVAVSGSHLATIAALVSIVLSATRLTTRQRIAWLAACTGAFVAFCGAPVSAVRAWLMSLVACGSQMAGRRAHALSSVSVVGCMMALHDPTVSGQLAFRLSVVSVAALCIWQPYALFLVKQTCDVARLPRRMAPELRISLLKAADGAASGLAATMVCQLATMPLVASSFGRVSLVAPATNLVAGPAVAGALGFGVCAGMLSWYPVACAPFVNAGEVVLWPALRCMELLAHLPLSSTPTAPFGAVLACGCPLVLVLCYLVWPDVKGCQVRRVLASCMGITVILLASWRWLAPARVVVLDVGQGDAILVQDGGHALLVDAGPEDAVAEALARTHVMHLDAVVVTHLHDDHYGGVAALVGTVACDRVVVANGVSDHLPTELSDACDKLTGSPPHELSYGDTMRVGGMELEMIWPRVPVTGMTNPDSIELLLSYERDGRRLTALLTGDSERDETGACILARDVGDIDLIKVGHHGSEESLTPSEVATLRPELAVASAGEGNSYGHPSKVCVQMLVEGGAKFLCTKDVGDVDVRPGRDGPIVFHPARLDLGSALAAIPRMWHSGLVEGSDHGTGPAGSLSRRGCRRAEGTRDGGAVA